MTKSMLSPRRSHGFHYPGGPTAVLLIHGLTGTPSELKSVGKGLARAGYSVYGVQLAGHCGSEAELLATNRQDWLNSVLIAFDRIRSDHETVFVGGLSMGALLALLVASERPGKVAGCLLYSATMAYDGWSVPRSSVIGMTVATILGFGRFLRFRENFPYGVKNERLRERLVAAMESGESADAGLLFMPLPSLQQHFCLVRALKKRLPSIRVPTLILHAREDDISSVKNASLIAARIGGRVEKILLENSYHLITIDQERDLVVAHSVAFLKRLTPLEIGAPTMAGQLAGAAA